MKKVGFQFNETMSGTYTRVGKPDEQGLFRFQACMHAEDGLRHMRDGLCKIDGTLDMEGFADDVPIAGTLEIAVFTKKIIRYDFGFTGNDGNPYRFAGQKNIRFTDFVGTMTHLTGSITDARGTEVAQATVKFDIKSDLLPFLVSWKPAFAG